jgi:hypothetical protein
MSGCFASSLQFFPLTLPPYKMRVDSAASLPNDELNHLRISACTSCACSVDATLPVPIALNAHVSLAVLGFWVYGIIHTR